MPDTSRKTISTTEAAQRAGLSRERLLRRIQVGEIEGELIAGRWLVFEESLNAYLMRRSLRPNLPLGNTDPGDAQGTTP